MNGWIPFRDRVGRTAMSGTPIGRPGEVRRGGERSRDSGTRISGGKNLSGKSPKAVNRVGQALRMAAMAARRSETFIGAKHRARLARMDTPVAIKATARDLACLIYLMVTEGQEYVEQGIDA